MFNTCPYTFSLECSPTHPTLHLSLHDALPISWRTITSAGAPSKRLPSTPESSLASTSVSTGARSRPRCSPRSSRSEEHTSELQSRRDLVCRLLLAKKNKSRLPPSSPPPPPSHA